MAQGTKEKNRLDDDLNPATRSMPSDESISDGIDQLQAHANDPANSSPSFKQREANASTSDGQESAGSADESSLRNKNKPEENTDNDTVGSGYSPNKKRRFSKRQLIGGGAIGGGIVGIFIFAMVSAPTFMVNYINDVLTQKIGDLQTRQQVRYRRSKIASFSDAFSRDGRLGGAVIAEMQADGYRFAFADPNDPNKISGVELPDGSRSIPNTNGLLEEHLHQYMEVKHPFRTSKWKTKRMNAFYNRYGITRRPITELSAADDLSDPDKALHKKTRESIKEEPYDPSVEDGRVDDTDEVDDATREQAREVAENQGIFEATNDAADEGVNPATSTNPLAKVHGKIETPDNEVLEVANELGDGSGPLGTIRGFGSLDIADRICTVKNRLRTAITAARNVRALSMLKYAMVFVGASDGEKIGVANASLRNSLFNQVTSLDSNGNPIGASPGFGYALKGVFSKSRNDAVKPGFGVDGTLNGVVGEIQNITDQVPLTGEQACGRWQNPIVQIGGGIVEIGATVVASVFSGGTAGAASQSAKQAVTQSVKTAVRKVFNSTLAKSLAKTIAVEISFEGVMALTQMYAEKTLTANFSSHEQGEQLGNVIVGGAGVANKQQSLQAGMVPATTTQYAQAHAQYLAEREEDLQNQSFFARMFDMNNIDSFAFNNLAFVPLTPAQALNSSYQGIQNIAKNPLSMPMSIATGIDRIFGGKTIAQSEEATDGYIAFDEYVTEGNNSNISLATDPAGNLLPVMRDDIAAIDVNENINELARLGHINKETYEPISDVFKSHIENCVNTIDTISMIEGGDFSKPEQDCMATQTLTKRFKAHLAYVHLVVDPVEAEFLPEDISENESPTVVDENNNASGPITVSGDKAFPLAVTKSQVGANFSNGDTGTAGHPYIAYDLIANQGTTAVAITDGNIVRVAPNCDGNTVGITLNVPSEGISFWYGHLDPSTVLVSEGQVVTAGTPLAKLVDSRVDCRSGADHLHIDASVNVGGDIYRPAGSRDGISDEDAARFRSIGPMLFDLYQELPD